MRLAWLIFSSTGALYAQVSPANAVEAGTVRELLASNDPVRLAWGAELAGKYGLREFVPELLPLLYWTDERIEEHALDALIRLKAKVPPEELTPLLPRFTPAVVILAMANGQRDLLLSMLREDQPHGPTWVALNEELIKIGGREYWTALLREWTIHVSIYVTDPGKSVMFQPGTGGGFAGDSLPQNRPGFPPRAAYSLTMSPRLGDMVLVEAPHPVYYRRQVNPSSGDVMFDRDDYRGDFVVSVLPTTPVKGHMRFDVAWQSDQDYCDDVRKLREQTLAEYREIVDRLIKRRLLPGEDTALKPRIELRIEDQRTNKAHDLPPTPPWE
jgi:hypothetical protein